MTNKSVVKYLESRKIIENFKEESNFDNTELGVLLYLGSNGAYDSKNTFVSFRDLVNGGVSDSPSRISTATSGFVRKGLVIKKISIEDQRDRELSLTQKGEDMYQTLEDKLTKLYSPR